LNKKKIINDPVYGFITIRSELIFDIIDHPYFQRLRRIKQLGLTDLIYPGAHHTRFHHAIGAMHLMSGALENLRNKGVEISEDEMQAAQIAILLHDIGHGPFSHALEYSLLENIDHEEISRLIIMELNKIYNGKLEMALAIFNGTYKKRFLHQLVSSQLDIDRMDYLMRDSFFTGVSEGTIGAERIIKMLDVKDDTLVVEEKGIYSIENFLSARRLMYWQVYLHKTSVSAEKMLISIIRRAKDLKKSGVSLFASPALETLLSQEISLKDFSTNKFVLNSFLKLDDYDIWGAIKIWADHEDLIISKLSTMLLNRNLFKIKLTTTEPDEAEISMIKHAIKEQYNLDEKDLHYYFSYGKVTNSAYIASQGEISILSKTGEVRDVVEAADLPNIKAMSKLVSKYYRCWPKDISL